MLPEGQDVVKITPLPESLVITHSKSHGVYTCPEDGCFFSTSSPSVLGLHKAQAHKIKTGPQKGVVHQYYCPHPGCYYNPETGRYFKNLDVLRSHYMKVHMEKKFKCNKCGKGFGLERDCLRHEKECGQSFTCPTCEKVYNNKGALRMHCVSKGHEKPLELCPKPKAPVNKSVVNVKQPKQDTVKPHPIPILPKFSPQDKISFIVPSKTVSATNATSRGLSLQVPTPISVILQRSNNTNTSNGNVVLSQAHNDRQLNRPLPVTIINTTNGKKLFCDNVAQTIKCLPPKLKAKRNAPTQTRLSILERAMKSSKIPITKTSKGTQKSLTGSNRKRKSRSTIDASTGMRKCKTNSQLTVATLTDPERMRFSQNIGSQTIFSILYQNQQKSMAVNTEDRNLKTSMSTQTSSENPLLHLDQRYLNNSNVSYQSQQISHYPIPPSDSNSQTFSPLLTQLPTYRMNSSETQTSLTGSSSSTTQTQESLALESSTQTLDLHLDNGPSLLDELFPESSGISVNTQTFGCFSSDMMTQTLEQLACDQSYDMSTSTLDKGPMYVTNDTTTQTFDEMVDSITQTFDSSIVDGTTQTQLSTDIMTQTFDNIGSSIMTQTINAAATSCVDCDMQPAPTQPIRSQPQVYDNICQTDFSIFDTNDIGTQHVTPENSCTDTTQTNHAFSTEILSLISESSISIQGDNISEGIQLPPPAPTLSGWSQTLDNQGQTTPTSSNQYREMALQTEDVDLWELSAQADTVSQGTDSDYCQAYGGTSVNDMASNHLSNTNPVTDSMTQTLSFPDDDMTLEALLSDMATQTFDEDDLTFDALLQSSDYLSSDFATQTPQTLMNTACQTPTPLSIADNKTDVEHSVSSVTMTGSEGESMWEEGTQTFEDVREMALQTENEDFWDLSAQMADANASECNDHALVDETLEIGTQTTLDMSGLRVVGIHRFENELWEMGTQTGVNNAWVMGTKAGGDNAWEMGTQIGGDSAWETGTQTGGHNAWETGTQTMGDNAWEMGTQTMGDNAWETGTQTMGDSAWETGTQTMGDSAWETGTQTGGHNAWETGTQTMGDNAWEMGTQTMGDNAWETGTRTMGDNAWEMGTQTGGDNAWETGTQTGVGNAWETETQTGVDNAWETGTQTMGDNAWETGTQTQTMGDNAWEIGTQTGGDNAWEMGTQTMGDNAWEMGTQTMANLLTDTMTQTGDDLIDFLLTGDT